VQEIPETANELLSVATVAHHLDVQPITVYRWCRHGRLRCLKLGKSWRIQRSDLETFLQQSHQPHSLAGYLDQFLTVPDHVLTVAEDAALLTQFDAAFFQVGAARGGLLVKVYNRRATSRSALQAGLCQHGLDVEGLAARGRFRWVPETTMEDGGTALQHLVTDESGETPIWAVFDWPSAGEMDAKVRQQETLADLVAIHPRLVVSTGVVEPEPEPDAWPPLAEQWQLLGSLRGLIRIAREGLLLSRVVKPSIT